MYKLSLLIAAIWKERRLDQNRGRGAPDLCQRGHLGPAVRGRLVHDHDRVDVATGNEECVLVLHGGREASRPRRIFA